MLTYRVWSTSHDKRVSDCGPLWLSPQMHDLPDVVDQTRQLTREERETHTRTVSNTNKNIARTRVLVFKSFLRLFCMQTGKGGSTKTVIPKTSG